MRAIAVLMVLAVHASPSALPNGFVGVDVFFVISGYLITSILCQELAQDRFSVRDFYVRRINRIFPALLLVLGTCLAIAPWLLYPSERGMLSKSAFFSTVFAANVHFYLESGYWDVASKLKPLLHLWSLGVEEQFYLVWPLLLWGACRARKPLWTVCAGVLVLSFITNLELTAWNQPAGFYLPFGRFWELAAGGLLACIAHDRHGPPPALQQRLGGALAWLGIGLLVATQFLPLPPDRFPGWWVLPAVLGTTLLIMAGPQAWLNRVVLAHPGMVYLGKLSYPLYLWHWPLLVAARLLGDGYWSSSHRNLMVLLAFVLAALTHHGVERPLARRVAQRGRLALVLAALMGCLGLAAWWMPGGIEDRSLPSAGGPLQEYSKPQITSTGGVHLLGDSNAGHFFHGLSLLYGDRLALTAAPGWPYLDGVQHSPTYVPLRNHQGSPQLTQEALQRIEADPQLRAVILSTAYRMYLPLDNLRSIGGPVGETTAQAYENGLRRTAQRLVAQGKKVVIVKSVPIYPTLATVIACSDTFRPAWRRAPDDCTRPRHLVDAERQEYDALVQRAVQGLPGVLVHDTLADLCDERLCYVHRNGIQMYVDSGHFTTAGSQIMGASLARTVEQVLRD